MSESPDELYSLLVPLSAERLLVPRMCVAEVITFTDARRETIDAALPAWYLGTIEWNGRRLPVVSFDPQVEAGAQSRRGRTRIVVFHAIDGVLRGGYYGVLTQGFPQLVRVNRDVLHAEQDASLPDLPPALCRARMIYEYPLIPDLPAIERMIASLPDAA